MGFRGLNMHIYLSLSVITKQEVDIHLEFHQDWLNWGIQKNNNIHLIRKIKKCSFKNMSIHTVNTLLEKPCSFIKKIK